VNIPEVTIAIPFRNPGSDLVLAVQSVFAQSFSDWELILCDDGSDDDSLEFASSLDDPRVRVMSDGQGKGLAPRLNETVRAARGEFYFRMDADDAMHPDRLLCQLEVLQKAGPSAVVGTACYSIDLDSRTVGMRPAPKHLGRAFAARHNLHHPTVAARTEWFRANPYSEKTIYFRSEDAELWCRTADTATVIVMERPLLYFREGGIFYNTKHLGTGLGVIQLVRDYSESRAECCYLLTREFGKIWLTSFMDVLGKAHWVVNRRFEKIGPESIRQADETLDRVKRQPLPTKQARALAQEFAAMRGGRSTALHHEETN
jgi:glycosyltransferase involved in cell wall biosynthesis